MQCYFCEETVGCHYYRLDSGPVICEGCLSHVGLFELLELLKISSFPEFLIRYGIAGRYTVPTV